MHINWQGLGEVEESVAGVATQRLDRLAERAGGLHRVSFIDQSRGGRGPEVKLVTKIASGDLGVVRTGETREAALLATLDGLEHLLRSRATS